MKEFIEQKKKEFNRQISIYDNEDANYMRLQKWLEQSLKEAYEKGIKEAICYKYSEKRITKS